MSRSDPERLRDILECIEAIDRAEATVARYPGDPDVAKIALDAVQSRVFTIGEAVKGLSLGLRQRYPDVPWSDMARMRDLIGHHYYKLDPQIVRHHRCARRTASGRVQSDPCGTLVALAGLSWLASC